LIALETHEQVFGLVLRVIAARGLMKGRQWEWMLRRRSQRSHAQHRAAG
jgi:hypothetical protein